MKSRVAMHRRGPVHVMDDGAKTYIQMPVETIHRELPVLVVRGPSGSEMVNYRVKDNMYIVDRLFDRAALLLGSGKHQVESGADSTGGKSAQGRRKN